MLLWRSRAARYSLAKLRWRRLGEGADGKWRHALRERQATVGQLREATHGWRSDAARRWRRSYNSFAVEATAIAVHDYVPPEFLAAAAAKPREQRAVAHPAAEPGPGGGPPTWLLTAESVLEATSPERASRGTGPGTGKENSPGRAPEW